MKVIGQAVLVLDINESDWAKRFWISMKVIGQAVLDINESDWASGSGYK